MLSPHDVAFAGDLLVVVDGRGFGRGGAPGGVVVYRVLDAASRRPLLPDEWVVLGAVTDERFAGANRVVTRGPFAYVGSSLAKDAPRSQGFASNVSILDLTIPAQPRLRGRVAFPDERGPNGLEIAGCIVFAAGGRTVQAIDVSQSDTPVELGSISDAALFPGGDDDGHDLIYHSGRLLVTAQTSHALVILTLADTVRARIE